MSCALQVSQVRPQERVCLQLTHHPVQGSTTTQRARLFSESFAAMTCETLANAERGAAQRCDQIASKGFIIPVQPV